MFKIDRQHLMMTSFDDYIAHMERGRTTFQKENSICDKDYYLTRRAFLDKLANKRPLFQRFLNRHQPLKLPQDDEKTLLLRRGVNPIIIRNIHGEFQYIQTQLNLIHARNFRPIVR